MNKKQQMLTEPIKRYLIQCVAKSGEIPERLPNELELYRRFDVCRETVHKAVEDLLLMGCLIHLDGKRGVFSNPADSSVMPYSIGIISVCGNCSYVDFSQTQILGSFLSHLTKINCMTTFMTLNQPPGTRRGRN